MRPISGRGSTCNTFSHSSTLPQVTLLYDAFLFLSSHFVNLKNFLTFLKFLIMCSFNFLQAKSINSLNFTACMQFREIPITCLEWPVQSYHGFNIVTTCCYKVVTTFQQPVADSLQMHPLSRTPEEVGHASHVIIAHHGVIT